MKPDPSSFRDFRGQVYRLDGRIFRTIAPLAEENFKKVEDTGILSDLVASGDLVEWWRLQSVELSERFGGMTILEHKVLPIISYPYEWTFEGLKTAALFQLDILLEALSRRLTMTDASAYNIQFIGTRPIFIDHLSFRPYQEGELWQAHQQFLSQFVNPLLLWAWTGESFHKLYRGNLEGISNRTLANLAPAKAYFSWRVLMHQFIPNYLEKRYQPGTKSVAARTNNQSLSRSRFRSLLQDLRHWIVKLEPKNKKPTMWRDYASNHSYSVESYEQKINIVAEFISSVKPERLWDLGCNVGDFSNIALQNGAGFCIGLDSDLDSLEVAFKRAKQENLRLLPLYQDLLNPSPDQGWNQAERTGIFGRTNEKRDAIIALAVIHHLVISGNIPLDMAINWITRQAENCLIEFIPPEDKMIKILTEHRTDRSFDLTENAFREGVLRSNCEIKKKFKINGGRSLFWIKHAKQ